MNRNYFFISGDILKLNSKINKTATITTFALAASLLACGVLMITIEKQHADILRLKERVEELETKAVFHDIAE